MFTRGIARFTTQTGEHDLAASVATSREERERGLFGSGPEWHGLVAMVLVFPPPWRAAVTMNGMSIPIDVVFVLPTGEVDSVVEAATPGSGVYYPTAGIAGWVVELPAGTARRLHVRRGNAFSLT